MSRRRSISRCDAGFTLLELVVVMAILAIALAMAAPRAGSRAPGARMMAQQFSIDARSVREAAIRDNAEHRLFIDLHAQTYATDTGLLRRLPASVRMSARTESDREEDMTLDVIFRSDGSAQEAALEFSDRATLARVVLEEFTGLARLEQRP